MLAVFSPMMSDLPHMLEVLFEKLEDLCLAKIGEKASGDRDTRHPKFRCPLADPLDHVLGTVQDDLIMRVGSERIEGIVGVLLDYVWLVLVQRSADEETKYVSLPRLWRLF